jgi:hypothetical protein
MRLRVFVGFLVGLVMLGFTIPALSEQSSMDQSQWTQSLWSKPQSARSQPELTPYTRRSFKYVPVYINQGSPAFRFYPTGFMGDHADLFVTGASRTNPHSGQTCLKVVYRGERMSQGARWAGMAWQYPAYNWGHRKGMNLTGVSKLVFWARGEEGNEIVEFFAVGASRDSSQTKAGPFVLSDHWKRYVIDLERKDLSSISTGFMFALTHDRNKSGAVIYLDDIFFI